MELKVKAINRSGTVIDERNTIVPEGYDYESLRDAAVLYSHNYKAIFGKTKGESNNCKQRLTVIKIQYDKKRIYRRFLTDNTIQGIDGNSIGLTPSSISELTNGDNKKVVGRSIEVSKACSFCYYWRHPFHATRISFQLGFPSLVIGMIALIVSIISLF